MPFPSPEEGRKAGFRKAVLRLGADERQSPEKECDLSKSRSVTSSGFHIHI